MDYFLKAADEQALMTKLAEVGAVKSYEVKDETGAVIETRYAPAQGVSLDIIGTISKPTGTLIKTSEGLEVPEMEQLEGFHANLRGNLDLSEKVELVMPEAVGNPGEETEPVEPIKVVTPSPIADILVNPKNPVRVWA